MDDNEDIFNVMPLFREDDNEQTQEEVDFTEAQLADFEDSFKRIDKTNSGTALISELGSLLRAVGLNPSLKLIREITEWFELNDIDRIDFNQFIKLLKNTWKANDPQELRQAIEVFDPVGNGYFTVDQLKNFLLSLGEPLDEDDFKEILKTISVQPDGTVNTEDIIQLLTADYK